MRTLGREDGAIAVLASLVLLVSLTASAFAVDLGALVLEQREARKVVDLAALDAVLVFSERSAEFSDPQAGAEHSAPPATTSSPVTAGRSAPRSVVSTRARSCP